jgi:hypothetical protein
MNPRHSSSTILPVTRQSHRKLALGLVVVASLAGLLAIFAIWAKRQMLETESWADTSTELLQQEEIRDAVADYLVAQLYANVDVAAEIAEVLPPEAQALAAPAAGALRQAAGEVARRALEDPRVQDLWRDANTAAHGVFVEVIEGGGERVTTEQGVVTLELGAVLAQVAAQLGIPGDVAAKVPEDAAQLEILRSDELASAQDAASALETAAWVLLALTLALYGVAIAISGDRRREMLRTVGIAFVLVGALTLLARNWAGNEVVASLASTAGAEPAVDATWEVGTSMLEEIAGAAIVYGVAFVLAAWLAGPTAAATSLREATAPWLRQPRFAFAAAAILLVLLFWWSPTPGFERLGPSLILIALVLAGTETLRRRTIAEFPDRVTPYSPAGLARKMADQSLTAVRGIRRPAESRSGVATEARLDALERLGNLHSSGVLDDEEFRAEKARLLEGTAR